MSTPLFPTTVCLRLTLLGVAAIAAGCDSTDNPSGKGQVEDTGSGLTNSEDAPENTAPTAPEVRITPADPTTDVAFEAVIVTESEDADGDSITYHFVWSIDGTLSEEHTEATVSADDTAKGQVWEVAVVAEDGIDPSEPAIDSTTILNTAPVVGSAVAAEEGARAIDTLTCTPVGLDDVDGDTVTANIAWFVNTTEVAAGDTLAPGFHAAGNEVFCRVTPHDGDEAGDPVDSNTIVIENAAPVVTELTVIPTELYTNDVLAASYLADDPDIDTLSPTFSWYVNGTMVASGSDGTLDGSIHFDKTDVVSVAVVVTDGTTLSDPVTSDDMVVLNSPPVGDSAELSPSTATTSDDITVTVTGSDADGDTVTWTYAWYVNGTVVSGATSSTLSSSYTGSGDTVYAEATPNDSETDGTVIVSDTLTISNTAPTMDSAALSPTLVYTDDTVTASGSGSDEDGDSLTYSYAWSVNGTAISATGSTLDGTTWFSKDDLVLVEVTANDGSDDSTTTASASVTILNTAPAGSSVSLSSATPATDESLTATASGTDDDSDMLTWTYAWYVNSTPVGGVTGDTLDASYTASGDSIYVVATPNDGDTNGTSVTSATSTVANSAPVASGVTLSPTSVYTNTTLTATPTATDADGDAITWTYAWYVGSTLVASGSDDTLDGTSMFDRAQVVYVVATPTDGTDSGSAVTSSSITVLNTAPTDATVAINPEEPFVDEDLVCDIPVPSTDDDGDAIAYTWDVDGVAYTGATTSTYTGDTVDSGDTAGEEVWTCTVTPSDGTDSAATVSASATIIEWDGPRTLTTCGGTGTDGPSQSGCDTEYTGTLLESEVIVSAGIQEWVVPADGDYVLTAYGAQGAASDATYAGGYGALAEGTFNLSEGDTLYIAVGQVGTGAGSGSNGAGGGGTFIVDDAGAPLVVAGGGGGTRESVSQDGCDAVSSEYGVQGSGSSQSSSCAVKSSSHGMGGAVSSGSWGSAGAGFFGDGDSERDTYSSWGGDGGYSWANGMYGGDGNSSCGVASEGGFGGGGSGDGCWGGGGGGGYSGGDGGRVAGGGGSYVDSTGTSTTKTSGYNSGDGWVVIDLE